MIDLSKIQKDSAAWEKRNFGETDIRDVALGICEEAGELAHYVLKRQQGIRLTAKGEDVRERIADAFGDMFIYGLQVLTKEGLDAEEVLNTVVAGVLTRDWKKFPINGRTQ